ncbi:hypothetical protein LSAT2_019830 [Lamellibrachia satsuma]|nr:hypothetical protein LSAT2_019830 [Lamellibrachia satsuma]
MGTEEAIHGHRGSHTCAKMQPYMGTEAAIHGHRGSHTCAKMQPYMGTEAAIHGHRDSHTWAQRQPYMGTEAAIHGHRGSHPLCTEGGSNFLTKSCNHCILRIFGYLMSLIGLIKQEKLDPAATFYGAQFLSYDLSSYGGAIISSNDKITLSFKTRQSNAMIFYTGDGDDFITIVMKEGSIAVKISLGSGVFESHISKDQGRHIAKFDDNEWHSMVVTRKTREVRLGDCLECQFVC